MDLFGRKRIAELEQQLLEANRYHAERIAEHVRDNIRLTKQLAEKGNQISYLLSTIREMDDQIFKMSQHTSWEPMRKHFTALYEGMLVRKRTESDRVSDLIRNELNSKALT